MSLDDLRNRIDHIDDEVIRLLNERTQAALGIGKLKNADGQEIYVPAREREVLQRVVSLNQGPLPEASVRAIYREIMSASLALERSLKVAYMGPPATFSHEAARERFGASVEYLVCETIQDVFKAVEKQTADYGIVPIENSTEGAVTHTLDELSGTSLKVCAEIFIPVGQNLLSKEIKSKIKRLYSHPQVFGQCRHWLQENMAGIEQVPSSSTAKAAEIAAGEAGSGALASELAAEMYGLTLLEKNIEDIHGNTTRFLVLSKSYGQPTGEDKTSLVFGIKHQAGALYNALEVFKGSGLNMSKIESRPSKSQAWEYNFFVDVEGHDHDDAMQKALTALDQQCNFMTVLGSYPKAVSTVQGS